MKKAIVTGASGFIGKTLVKALTEREYEVLALDIQFDESLERNPFVYCQNVANASTKEIASLIEKDEYSVLFHLAWVGTSGLMRANYNVQLDNARLTCQYVELCQEIGCKRMIYASSINEMETYDYLQSDNIEPSGGYIYGTGKLAAHLMGETLAYMKGVDFIPVIITNIYGAGENSARLINTSIRKLLRGEHCSFTEGYQTYDFIYLSDAINSIIEVSEKGHPFKRYYIGSGEPKTLREFLMRMRDIVDPNASLGFGEIPFRGVSVDYKQFDLRQIEEDTGYVNQVSFEQGIQLTLDSIKNEIITQDILTKN